MRKNIGIFFFIITFLYSIIIEIIFFNKPRLISRIEYLPLVLIGMVLFIITLILFYDKDKK